MRLRTGYVYEDNGKWYARFDYKTPDMPRKKTIRRLAKPNTEAAATRLLNKLLLELEERGLKAVSAEVKIFKDLAEYYEKRYLIPPQYVQNRKVAGLRSHKKIQSFLKPIKGYFAGMHLSAITHSTLEDYKAKRLATKTVHGQQRGIASVNRELEVLRKMLNVAVRESWLRISPFKQGDSLVSKADEKRRQRILSYEEEGRLLAVCVGRRKHLAAIIVFEVDMGPRRGEAFKLTWDYVDFANQQITLHEATTKTMKERKIGMTDRVLNTLSELYSASDRSTESFVFSGVKDVKRAFGSARKAANLPDLRFHDLRHYAEFRTMPSRTWQATRVARESRCSLLSAVSATRHSFRVL